MDRSNNVFLLKLKKSETELELTKIELKIIAIYDKTIKVQDFKPIKLSG